jgi:outer membrane immunogenic protein
MNKYPCNSQNLVWLFLIGLVFLIFPEGAFASTENDQLLAMMHKLEARVDVLEAKNSEYRTEIAAARQQAKVANEKLKSVSAAASPARNSYASYVKAEPTAEGTRSIWSGAYWGASGGGANTRSRVTSTEQYSASFPTNTFPFNISGQNMADVSGPGHRWGALIDLFAGWNFQISSAFVVGGQLEATASDLNFNSAGTRTYTYFDGSGPTGQTAVSDFRPQISSNWMASALLRAGFLVDDKTLIYGIGGLTLAQFQARNLADNSFNSTRLSWEAAGPLGRA